MQQRTTRFRTDSPSKLKLLIITLAVTAALLSGPAKLSAQTIPLANGFAHNDYWHKRPLFDALENGFRYIEADIFLLHDRLIVAHTFPFFKSDRTLDRLYLKPLANYIKNHPDDDYPITLMIDIKTSGNNTYEALKPLLDKYADIISGYEDGHFIQRRLTVVLSGHKPFKIVRREQSRMVFIDEDLRKMDRDNFGSELYPIASCPYKALLQWDGNGHMPDNERKLLTSYVLKAHKLGKKVRLWASPENKTVWTELLTCGVDLINTDQLAMLREFLNTSYAAAK